MSGPQRLVCTLSPGYTLAVQSSLGNNALSLMTELCFFIISVAFSCSGRSPSLCSRFRGSQCSEALSKNQFWEGGQLGGWMGTVNSVFRKQESSFLGQVPPPAPLP